MIRINGLVILLQAGLVGSHLAVGLTMRGLVLGGDRMRVTFMCNWGPTDVTD